MRPPTRIVALADTDSYVKWAGALLGTLDAGWDASLLVVETPLVVSDSQLESALAGSGLPRNVVSRVKWENLGSRLEALRADVVVLAGRGPLVRVLARAAAALTPRPVLVTGLPGISIPATRKAIAYRTQCDLFVLHSRRECRDFTALATERGMPQRFALASLPFARGGPALGLATLDRAALGGMVRDGPALGGMVHDGPALGGMVHDGPALGGMVHDGPALDGMVHDGPALDGPALDGTALDETALDETALDETALDGMVHDGTARSGRVHDGPALDGTVRSGRGLDERTLDGRAGTDLVFAPQAKVPAERVDRLRVARLLVRAAEADPSRRVVVKLRAAGGEQQTHAERDSYPDLLATLGPLPPNLVTSTSSMRKALTAAEGLVTVSSTAAIEAVARGIPVIALDSFGVAPELINEVLADAGVLGDEDDVIARRFRHPDAAWLDDNYFHDAAADDWVEHAVALVDARRAGTLAPRMPLARRGGALRDVWERKSVLGAQDRTIQGKLALVIGMPLRFAARLLQRVRGLVRPAAPVGR